MRLIVLLGLACTAIGAAAANAPPPPPQPFSSAATDAVQGPNYRISADDKSECTILLVPLLAYGGKAFDATVAGDSTACYEQVRQAEGFGGKLVDLVWSLGPTGEIVLAESDYGKEAFNQVVFVPNQDGSQSYEAQINGRTIRFWRVEAEPAK